jgi:hypothetical protein
MDGVFSLALRVLEQRSDDGSSWAARFEALGDPMSGGAGGVGAAAPTAEAPAAAPAPASPPSACCSPGAAAPPAAPRPAAPAAAPAAGECCGCGAARPEDLDRSFVVDPSLPSANAGSYCVFQGLPPPAAFWSAVVAARCSAVVVLGHGARARVAGVLRARRR